MSALEKMQVQINDRELVFMRMFDAPLQLVWDAWTKKEHLLKWWGPHGFTSKDCSVDLKEGGSLSITMVGMGADHPCYFHFFEFEPFKKFVWTEKSDVSNDPRSEVSPPASSITVLFDDIENRTRVTMIFKFKSNEDRDKDLTRGDAEGWAEMFEKLDKLLTE